MKNLLCLVIAAVIMISRAQACPLVRTIPDFNCDGKLSIAVLGDSLAYGIGDSRYNNRGGYVIRTAKKLRFAQVTNLGVPGLHASQLLVTLRREFRHDQEGERIAALRNADIVILDVGRNDRWSFGAPVDTYRNLKLVRDVIKRNTVKLDGTSPLVVIAVMMLPNRGSQGPWMKELNGLILEGSTAENPSDLRFDLVSKRLLNSDQIHPTSPGYEELAKTLVAYITKKLPKRMRKLRPDRDSDGVYDIFETLKFLTDPSAADTDGDGKPDGQEIFSLKTDPLTPDL